MIDLTAVVCTSCWAVVGEACRMSKTCAIEATVTCVGRRVPALEFALEASQAETQVLLDKIIACVDQLRGPVLDNGPGQTGRMVAVAGSVYLGLSSTIDAYPALARRVVK